jgi:hypothetical protein
MTQPSALEYLPLLHKALASPFGIVIKTNDPQRAKGKLYAARQLAPSDEAQTLAGLQIRTSSEAGQLWIVKGSAPKASPLRALGIDL